MSVQQRHFSLVLSGGKRGFSAPFITGLTGVQPLVSIETRDGYAELRQTHCTCSGFAPERRLIIEILEEEAMFKKANSCSFFC